MRIESSVTSVSWIPSEAIRELLVRMPFQLGVTHYDRPPPDVLNDLAAWRAANYFRFANELRGWIEVEDGKVSGFGHLGKGHIGATDLRIGSKCVAIRGVSLPDLQSQPEVTEGAVRFVQTTGGRTGLPAPRRVRRPPFMQLAAPLAWTTLSLTIRADGSSVGRLEGASSFPRHWIYGDDGRLIYKTGLMDFSKWYREAFGTRTPWGNEDSPALTVEVESALERDLANRLMKGDQRPQVRTIDRDEKLIEQGAPGAEVFLLLDGVMVVEIDGKPLVEVAPGAILGERAIVEGGTRTSTLRAVTPCRVAAFSQSQVSRGELAVVALHHKRESRAAAMAQEVMGTRIPPSAILPTKWDCTKGQTYQEG